MGKAVAMINGEALSLLNLSDASAITKLLPDRNKEMVSLLAICLYFFTSFGGVLISHVQQLPAVLIIAWVGFGIALLLKLARPFTKCDMLAIGCMCAWVPLSYVSWSETSRFVVSELAAAIIVLQAIHLTRRMSSFARKDTMGETIFYGSLHSLVTFFRLLSMFLIFRSLRSLSTLTSFYYALASCLFLAYAVWLGRHQHDDRGLSNGRILIYTCSSSGSRERPNFWIHALLVVVLHAPTAFSFLSFFTHMTHFESDMEAAFFLFDATLYCFASALYFQVMFLTPIRIQVVTDGTILVETYGGQTFGYHPKAIRVFDRPIEDLPEATDDRCHVFCETGMTTTTTVVVVVELTNERFLYLTPNCPEDFVAAVRRSLEMVDVKDNNDNNKQQVETVVDLERQEESKSLTGSVDASTTL